MGAPQRRLATEASKAFEANLASYWREGYAVVRGFFDRSEISEIAKGMEQLYAEGVAHGRCFRHANLFYNVARETCSSEPLVRMVQWPSYHQAVMNEVRLDSRFARLLEPLIGCNLKQIINQVHWKAPGSLGDFAWHQDSRFRNPASAYRNLATAYVQTGLAIDSHNQESGCMRFIPRSHLQGELDLDCSNLVMGSEMNDSALEPAGLSASAAVDVLMEPGDLALWSPYLVHGSGKNRSSHRRRLYINGYVKAFECDRGEWAFRNGEAVPLGPKPALVHYDELEARPDPHYPD